MSAVPSSLGGRVDLLVFGLIGLLGGAHCLGMCGPLVTAYADRLESDDRSAAPGDQRRLTWRAVRQHALFNAGRTAGYAAVGAAMGALGAVLYDAAAVVAVARGVRAIAGVVVGLLVLVTGLTYLRYGAAGGHLLHSIPGVGGALGRLTGALGDRLDDWVRGPRVVALGTVHAALPCPLLYPAYLYAFATGSPVTGATSLAALGLGTFPTLFAYGTLVTSVSATSRARLHRALGAAFVLLGYIPLTGGLALLGVHLPRPPIPFYQPLG